MVKEELMHFLVHQLATMMSGLIGKVSIERVTAVQMGFAEFLTRSWSKMRVVGEYCELRVCPGHVKPWFMWGGEHRQCIPTSSEWPGTC